MSVTTSEEWEPRDFDFVCVDCGCNTGVSDNRNWSVVKASRCLYCANAALSAGEGLVEASNITVGRLRGMVEATQDAFARNEQVVRPVPETLTKWADQLEAALATYRGAAVK